MTGPVVEEQRRDGSTRLRCTICDKVAKQTLRDAEAAVGRIYRDRQYMMKAYYSAKCGWWHLATVHNEQSFKLPESEQEMAKGKQLTRYDERFAEMAQEYASTERAGGDFLSTKGGILTFDNEPLPGNQMLVVILDVVHERTFYTQKYDQNAEFNLPPVCYAFGRTRKEVDEMAPHPTMQVDLSYFQPQNDVCADCPHNEWGSADTGRGKACGERRRIALLPAGFYTPKKGSRGDFDTEIFTDNEHYESADIAYMKTSVTSVKDYARYVAQLNSSLRLPPMAVITRVYLEPDADTTFKIRFEMIEQLPEDVLDTILERHEEAKANIIFGYSPPSIEARAGAGSKRRGIRR